MKAVNTAMKLSALAIVLALAISSFAQESTVKGNIGGVVQDSSGAVIAGATVTLTGETGSKTATTDNTGKFLFPTLIPGFYSLKVEKTGFRTAQVPSTEALTGRTSNYVIKMDPGTASETVEVRADTTTVDTQSTAVGSNLTDEFYAKVPIQRNVASLFYTAPGVDNGGGTGAQNPSISGSSGLENLYIADGVNITDSAYGALGVFTRNQGPVGTGINLSFIKEVDVKTGGFEPQYGQATGGIVQIITKSGSNKLHGAISAYMSPTWSRGSQKFSDDFRTSKIGQYYTDVSAYEATFELGGYIPGARNHLFFFGSFDPSWARNYATPPQGAGIAALGTENQRTNTYNWAGKLTYRINDKHSIEGSAFGDPAHTNTAQLTPTPLVGGTLNVNNTTGFSRWSYGTQNVVARYNGTLSPTWLVNGSYTHKDNYFHETPLSDVFQITDATSSNVQVLQGFGLLETHDSHSNAFGFDTSKVFHFLGEHTFSIGFSKEYPHYDDRQNRSGGTFIVPSTNFLGQSYLPSSNPPAAGSVTDAQFQLLTVAGQGATCTICPTYVSNDGTVNQVVASMIRGQFGGSGLKPTHGMYQAAFANDVWSPNKHINISAGVRWDEQQVAGTLTSYTFTGNWSPRLGISYDPWADRKTKIYFNYGIYTYALPLDVAIRSLSGENDLNTVFFAPIITNNVVSITPDAAHLVNGTGGFPQPSVSTASLGENFLQGSKSSYEKEYVAGVEREWRGIVFSVRYLDRRLQRIVEDFSGTSPEGSQIYQQVFAIGNPQPGLDAYVNETQVVIPAGTLVSAFPSGCNTTNTLGVTAAGRSGPVRDGNGNQFSANSICFPNPNADQLGADGKADGFAKPIRNYQAVEIEVNKSFSKNYLMRFNYRWARLVGNYEGAFRNDNGQSDPGISSLFDFTPGNFGLLGDQFRVGPLNTDRTHVFNGFFSYTFPSHFVKGLTMGSGLRVESGTPISVLGNHPVYLNAGEVPIGGRGVLGRTNTIWTPDLKLDYPWKINEWSTLRFSLDAFNIFNLRTLAYVDQFRDQSNKPAGSNPDFLHPQAYPSFQDPFVARFSVKWEF